MDNELINKLDNIVKDLNNTYEARRTIELKNKLLSDKELIDEINEVKSSEYDNNYVSMKKNILNNNNYKEYKELESNFYFFSKEVSSILSSLTK